MEVFKSGAKRSSKKPNYHQVDYSFLRRLALRHSLGSETYDSPEGRVIGGLRNWRKAFTTESGEVDMDFITQFFNHLVEHLYLWKDKVEKGISTLDSDDDLAAVAWGVQALMAAEEAGFFLQGHKPEPELFEQETIDKGPGTYTREEVKSFFDRFFRVG